MNKINIEKYRKDEEKSEDKIPKVPLRKYQKLEDGFQQMVIPKEYQNAEFDEKAMFRFLEDSEEADEYTMMKFVVGQELRDKSIKAVIENEDLDFEEVAAT